MKRLLCAVLLIAAIPANSVAHAQQGNLPKPVQKLSPYPPVVCVTPDWRPEPCEDRNASGWQCGNVKVTVSSKGNWFEGDWSTEYLEPISKSFEEDDEAGKLDKAEEIVGVVLPANEDPALPSARCHFSARCSATLPSHW